MKEAMTTLAPRQIWQAALGDLQVQLAGPSFDTFLQNTSAMELSDGRLVIGTPNSFVAEYLEKRLYSVIRQAVEGVTRHSLEIQFQVATAPGPPTNTGGVPPLPVQPRTSTTSGGSHAGPTVSPRRHTFDSFVVGPSNELAHAAAVSAAEHPGTKYNPVFIYSDVGLGKTHLLRSIQHRAGERNLNVLCLSCEQFTNDFIQSIRSGRAGEFRQRYRDAGILLIDDIQFLSGKEQTQEGFFHIFNELHQANSQIVLTSDRPPRELSFLEDRLRSRFEGGLIADIHPPSLEMRQAILRSKASHLSVLIPREVLDFIGQLASRSIRVLEGCLNRVAALAEFTGRPVTTALAKEALGGIAPIPAPEQLRPETTLAITAAYYGLPITALQGPRRDRRTARARHVAVYLLRECCQESFAHIGRLLGGRDHSTVYHAWRKIGAASTEDSSIHTELLAIKEQLLSQPAS